MNKKNIINVPVFKTELQEGDNGLFELNMSELADSICEKIREFGCSNTNKILIEYFNKSYHHEIVKITPFKIGRAHV